MIKCENCNAMIDENAAKCPYCGVINVVGSEKEYLDNLDDLRENMAELSSVEDREVRKEISKSLKLVIIICACTAALIGILCLSYYFINRVVKGERDSEEFIREKLSWEAENYPKMNALYDEGDFEELSKYVKEKNDNYEPGVSGYYNWPHYHILEYYNYLSDFRIFGETLDTGRSSKFWYIASAFSVLDDGYEELNTTDTKLREEYRKEVREGLRNNLNMSDEEVDSLFEKCHDENDFMSFDLMKKEIEEYIDEKHE